MNFFRTPFFLPLLYPSLIWRIDTGSKELFLTFDDGPVPGPTNFALEVLNKFKAKATFFCIGENIRKHPGIFHRIVEEGHAVGNHTFNHLDGWKYTPAEYLENVELCTKEIDGHLPASLLTFAKRSGEARREAPRPSKAEALPIAMGPIGAKEGNRQARLFRPPYGKIKYAQIKALDQYRILMWDVLTFDYDTHIPPARCLNGAIRATRTGSIVLFHDSIKAEKNMSYALPLYLEHFSTRGFTFQPLA